MLHAQDTRGDAAGQDVSSAFGRSEIIERLAMVRIRARKLALAHAADAIVRDQAQLLFENRDACPVAGFETVAPEPRDFASLGDVRRPTAGP